MTIAEPDSPGLYEYMIAGVSKDGEEWVEGVVHETFSDARDHLNRLKGMLDYRGDTYWFERRRTSEWVPVSGDKLVVLNFAADMKARE